MGVGVGFLGEVAVGVLGLLHDERERGGLLRLIREASANLLESEGGGFRVNLGLLQADAVAFDRIPFAFQGAR